MQYYCIFQHSIPKVLKKRGEKNIKSDNSKGRAWNNFVANADQVV